MPVQLSIDQQALQSLARALNSEADGKKLRRELAKNIRTAMEPVKNQALANLAGITDTSRARATPALRPVIRSKVKAQARLSGRTTGARLHVGRKGMPRDFALAARRLNRTRGWRHRVFGTDTWVQQVARPDKWFDRATERAATEARKAVLDAMEAMAQRIAGKVR